MHFTPENPHEHQLWLESVNVPDYCANCGRPYSAHYREQCPTIPSSGQAFGAPPIIMHGLSQEEYARKVLKIALILFAVLASYLPLHAQTDAPTHQTISRLDWSLLVADTASRSIDVYSTRAIISRGGHEVLIPKPIANHTASEIAYSGGVVIMDWYLMRRLEKTRPGLAHLLMSVEIGQNAAFVSHNMIELSDVHRSTVYVRLGGAR